MPKDTIRLRKEHQKELADLLLLQRHHQQLAVAIGNDIARLVQTGYGVDINRENWELDAGKGVLHRAPHD